MMFRPELDIDDTQSIPRITEEIQAQENYPGPWEDQTTVLPKVSYAPSGEAWSPPTIKSTPNETPAQTREAEPYKATRGVYLDPVTHEAHHAIWQDGVLYKGSRFDPTNPTQCGDDDFMVTRGRIGHRDFTNIWGDSPETHDRQLFQEATAAAARRGVRLLVEPTVSTGAPALAGVVTAENRPNVPGNVSPQQLPDDYETGDVYTQQQAAEYVPRQAKSPKTHEQRLRQKKMIISAAVILMSLVSADGAYNTVSGNHDTFHPLKTGEHMYHDGTSIAHLIGKIA